MEKEALDIDIDLSDIADSLTELEIDSADLSMFSIDEEDSQIESRYTKPILTALKGKHIMFDNAVEMAKAVRIDKGERIDAIISGNFVFGDFIGAFLSEHDVKATEMTVATLSLSPENVMMFRTLMELGYIDNLNLVISHYFYQHNLHTVVPFIYEQLDDENKGNFQLAIAATHMKIVLFKTLGGKHIVIHGSANLRSSANIEQFTIEENESLYNFYNEAHNIIINKYKTINKALRRNALRDALGIEPSKTRGGLKL